MYTRAYGESHHFMSDFPLQILQGLALWIKKKKKKKDTDYSFTHFVNGVWDWEQ